MENKDVYFVAVKVFLVDTAGKFLIVKDRFGDWDIPGGRLKENEFAISLGAVIERKIKEELGDALGYELGEPAVFMRHERDEILPDGKATADGGVPSEGGKKRRIFAVGYMAKYVGGQIKLGKNHEKFEWVDIKTFASENYFSGGWLAGIKEFQTKYKKK